MAQQSIYYSFLQDPGYNFVRARAFTSPPNAPFTYENLINFINPNLPEAQKGIIQAPTEIVENDVMFMVMSLHFSVNPGSQASYYLYGFLVDNRNAKNQILGYSIFTTPVLLTPTLSQAWSGRFFITNDENKE